MRLLRTLCLHALLAAAAAAAASGALARDRGVNQPGAVGGTAGVGAPGAGTRDPALAS